MRGRSRRIWSKRRMRNAVRFDHIETGWIEALEATRIYGFSKYRGAREHSLKIIISISLHKPTANVIAEGLKLRKRFGTMIFAVGMYTTDQLRISFLS